MWPVNDTSQGTFYTWVHHCPPQMEDLTGIRLENFNRNNNLPLTWFKIAIRLKLEEGCFGIGPWWVYCIWSHTRWWMICFAVISGLRSLRPMIFAHTLCWCNTAESWIRSVISGPAWCTVTHRCGEEREQLESQSGLSPAAGDLQRNLQLVTRRYIWCHWCILSLFEQFVQQHHTTNDSFNSRARCVEERGRWDNKTSFIAPLVHN